MFGVGGFLSDRLLDSDEEFQIARNIRAYTQGIHSVISEVEQEKRQEIAQAIQDLTHKVVSSIE
jgi:hypothetical protein